MVGVMKVVGAFLMGVVVTLLVAVAVLYFADLDISESDPSVSVPNVLGQQAGDAEDELEGAGLRADVSKAPLGPLESGGGWYDRTVSTQNPDPGTEVVTDSTVTLGVE